MAQTLYQPQLSSVASNPKRLDADQSQDQGQTLGVLVVWSPSCIPALIMKKEADAIPALSMWIPPGPAR